MWRFSFLPSDFHPLLLVLGETDGLAEFAVWLRRFADTGTDRELEKAGFAGPGDTNVGKLGIVPTSVVEGTNPLNHTGNL